VLHADVRRTSRDVSARKPCRGHLHERRALIPAQQLVIVASLLLSRAGPAVGSISDVLRGGALFALSEPVRFVLRCFFCAAAALVFVDFIASLQIAATSRCYRHEPCRQGGVWLEVLASGSVGDVLASVCIREHMNARFPPEVERNESNNHWKF